MTTTIILADDHTVVRQGLRALLQTESEFEIVGEAADGLKAADLVDRLRPDVLITDLMMPGLGGLEVTRRVAPRGTKVVILSMHADESYVVQALRDGASAYVLKESTADDLLVAIREVQLGRRYLSPPLSLRAIESYLHKTEATPIDPHERLTAREREVLHLAAEGRSSQEIASRLFISPRTVEIHRGNLMRKLGLHNQTELVRYALKRGILSLDS